jgi:ankyrin repeat protein
MIASEWKEHEEIVTLLINKEAKINEKDNDGRTVLHYGILLIEIFKKMLLIDCFNKLFVFIASRDGREVIVKLLLNKNASVNEKASDGCTALHWGMILIGIFKNILLINCFNSK